MIQWKGHSIEIAKGEFGFKLKNNITIPVYINKIRNINGISIMKDADKNKIGLLKIALSENYNLKIQQLEKLDLFEKIYPNCMRYGAGINPDDTYISSQYAITNMDLKEAWEITRGSSDIMLSILDSGIPMENGELCHDDLIDESRYLLGTDAVGDGNSVMDENGHGTHVAGIAVAQSNNGEGIAGVNWNSKVYICQALDKYRDGTARNFYDAVVDAVDDGGVVPFSVSENGNTHDGSGSNDIGIEALPVGDWIEQTNWEGYATINQAGSADFSLKCEVTDSQGNTDNDTHSIRVLGGFNKKGLGKNTAIPDHYELSNNYPNPFNPVTTLAYAIPEEGSVLLQIFDVKGNLI